MRSDSVGVHTRSPLLLARVALKLTDVTCATKVPWRLMPSLISHLLLLLLCVMLTCSNVGIGVMNRTS